MATHVDIICPHCGTANNFHVSRLGKSAECLKCDGVFIPAAPTVRAVRKPKPVLHWTIPWPVLLLLVAGGLFSCCVGLPLIGSRIQKDLPGTNAAIAESSIRFPEIGSFQSARGIAGKDFAHCFADEQAIVQMLEIEEDGDIKEKKAGRSAMYLAERAWPVQNAERVKILDINHKTGFVFVRIIGGNHAGQTGWIHALECGGASTAPVDNPFRD